MLKVLINGIAGKMGSEVAKAVKNDKELHLLGGLDKHIIHNLPYPVFDDINDILEKPNVIIDFSIPSATISILPFALQNKIPVVIATTGFSSEEQNKIIDASLQIPIFQSANMSYEMAIMNDIVTKLSLLLKNAEIEIVETHHSKKKDSPSGTALMLADSINEANNNNFHYALNRFNETKSRDSKEIGFSSIRGGNIVGEHKVLFFGQNETLEIKHTAYSRTIFADGAIRACKFLAGQENGLYNMKSML